MFGILFVQEFFKDECTTFKIDVEAFDKKLSIDAKKEWINVRAVFKLFRFAHTK